MIKEILNTIKLEQSIQDSEGKDHPEQQRVFTFPAPWIVRLWLKVKRVKGLSFESYNGEWYGIFRAQK